MRGAFYFTADGAAQASCGGQDQDLITRMPLSSRPLFRRVDDDSLLREWRIAKCNLNKRMFGSREEGEEERRHEKKVPRYFLLFFSVTGRTSSRLRARAIMSQKQRRSLVTA